MSGPLPRARGLATILALAGTMLIGSPLVLASGYLLLVVPLLAHTRLLRVHSRFTVSVLAPIALLLVFVWGGLVGAPPSAPRGSAPLAGGLYAVSVVLRLAIAGGLFQLCMMSLPADQLAATLHRWGVRGHGLVVALGGYTLMTEMGLRAEQIVGARYARGLVPSRGLLHRARQLPYTLRPLMTWLLRAALQRSEVWEHRQIDILLTRSAQLSPVSGSTASSWLCVALASAWLGIGIIT